MVIRWGMFSAKSRTALKTGWLITAGVIALYLGVIQPRDQARGIASEKATGLAAVSGSVVWEPISLWRQTSLFPHLRSEAYLQKGIVGGVPCGSCRHRTRLSHDIFGRMQCRGRK